MSDQKDKLSLSISVLSIEKPADYKKDTNFICKLKVSTNYGEWELNRSFKDFDVFHSALLINESFRGLNFPKVPTRKGSVASIDEHLKEKKSEYTSYLTEILHRSVFLGAKDILDFIQAPEQVRRAAKQLAQMESVPVKSGQMKKEGEKWKGYRLRFFVLLPNYLLQYYETADAYSIGIQPKGSIDLTLATKILVYDKTSNPFSMGIKTPNRIWKLQCDTESDRDEWVQSLRNLLQNPQFSGYVADYNASSNNSNGYAKKVSAEKTDKNDENEMKIQKDLDDQAVAMEEQDRTISELQNKMQRMMSSQTKDAEKIKDEISLEYKQQLDMQRETLVKWKEQITELTDKLTTIEEERQATAEEYENNITALKEENATLTKGNEEKATQIAEKDDVINKTEKDVKQMATSLDELKMELEANKSNMMSISGDLNKVQGDAVNKLKYAKSAKKKCVFVNQINTLFYYDPSNQKSEQKYLNVVDVITKQATISKNCTSKFWFQIKGKRRIALFTAVNQIEKNKWVDFINKSLGKSVSNPSADNDDKKDDSP